MYTLRYDIIRLSILKRLLVAKVAKENDYIDNLSHITLCKYFEILLKGIYYLKCLLVAKVANHLLNRYYVSLYLKS